MSYWIPFKKKEKEPTFPSMLSLDTMFRLHEIAESLAMEESFTPPPAGSIGFFCGCEKNEDIEKMLPFDPPDVIRMKKEDFPDLQVTAKALSATAFVQGVVETKESLQEEAYTFINTLYLLSVTVTGMLYPTPLSTCVLATLPGSPYGNYVLKDAPKNPRQKITIH